MTQAPRINLAFQSGPTSFSAQSGQLVHIWGLSGAGKSTLLAQIWGSRGIPDGQTVVRFQGQELELSALSPAHLAWARPKLMAYLPQDPHILPSVCMSDWFAEMDPDHRNGALGALDLSPDLLKHCASELSGGELRRFCILRVLQSDAPVLLLDEPCAGLDPDRQDRTLNLLRNVRNSGRLIISTGHTPNALANRSIRL